MPLNNEQKVIFKRQMSRLEEDGFFPEMQRAAAAGTRYLIISYGGTGAEALFSIKKKLESVLPQKDYEEYVRLLAIDTDKNTQSETQKIKKADGTETVAKVDALTDQQFFYLPAAYARNAVEHEADSLQDWINPNLPAKILADPSLLDGNGASATRQLGRLTLFPTTTVQHLEERIKRLVGELTNKRADNLKIFVVTGIAGGTGSGTVIDLTYLIRNFVESMPGNIYTRTEICGFILLPPTGNSTNPVDIAKGNRNGYAALKEINQFMTLAYRGEVYEQRFGAKLVTSKENIFKVCYLMDGVQNGVALGTDARAIVKNVLAECILDMITTQPIVQGDSNPNMQVVDSFMSDAGTFTANMVSKKSENEAPRDVDYIYCTLGHGEMPIPINLMKAYIANQIFNRMWEFFSRCSNVTDEDAQEFLKKVTLPNSKFTNAAQGNAIVGEIDRIFQDVMSRKGGPFYVINLLVRVGDAIQLQMNKAKLFRYNHASDEQLNFIQRVCTQQNNNTFTVYVAVMEEMRKVLQKENGIVCDTHRTTSSYCFEPISLGDTEGKSKVVREYLDGLINPNVMNQLTMEMLQEMIRNKQTWTQLFSADKETGAFDGVNAVRGFWTERIDKILRATLEDFLIKYYSGNSKAHYDKNDPQNPETVQALQDAASEIYQEMFGAAGRAHPLADYTPNNCLTAGDFNGHNYILIPEEAPHLLQAVRDYAASVGNAANDVKVFSSYARDRISCYAQFTSIPAFKLSWACSAEKDYENALAAADAGLHMSESPSGQLWREFPNLLPKSTWKLVPMLNYINQRENVLAERAQQLFQSAHALGLTSAQAIAGGANFQEYKVKVLPEDLRPAVELYRRLDVVATGSREQAECSKQIQQKAEECAEKLFESVQNWSKVEWLVQALENAENPIVFASKNLKTTNAVLTSNPAKAKPDGWDEFVAAQMLRKMPDTMNDLRGTLAVMEILKSKVDAFNASRTLIVSFSKFLTADVFTYNEDYFQWEVAMPNGLQKCVCELEPGDKTEKAAEYYLLFKGLSAKKDDLMEVCEDLYTEASTAEERKEKIAKLLALKEKAKELADKVQRTIYDKANTDPRTMIGTKDWETVATKKGMDVETIRSFYSDLVEELKLLAE